MNERRSEADRILDIKALDSQNIELTEHVTALQEQNERFRAEKEKVKHHYKELYDSIKITRAKTIEKTTSLLTKNEKLKAQVKGKMQCVTMPAVKPKVLAPGVNSSPEASESKPRNNTKNNRILPAKSDNKKKVEAQPRNNKSKLIQENHVDFSISSKRTCVVKYLTSVNAPHVKVKQVWKATGKLFANVSYQWKPTRRKFTLGEQCPLTRSYRSSFVRFENDHFGAIMGYGDYVIGDSMIFRVYYVEGLGHNLFSVRKFCDSDLEVAFRKHSCYVRNEDGVDLLKGSHGLNMYTISVEDMMKFFPICLLSKASKNKSWLWHRRLNHLNFGTINDLARKDLVRGLTRLKFEKDHRCSACQLGKSKKYTRKPKSENTIMEVLHTLHMDLCGPMRVQNRTLVEATRTMLIFLKALMFLWAEAVATAFFGALCYPTNDSKDLGKLKAIVDIGIFVGYAPNKKGSLSVERPITPAPTIQILVVSAGTPSSTIIDQDEPSTSHSPSSSEVQPPISHQDVAAGPTIEDNPFP
ncbi:retrovirus-related pol polyprotein from transposon TNT 1-94 [Tanacetum coccineum]